MYNRFSVLTDLQAFNKTSFIVITEQPDGHVVTENRVIHGEERAQHTSG